MQYRTYRTYRTLYTKSGHFVYNPEIENPPKYGMYDDAEYSVRTKLKYCTISAKAIIILDM